MNKKTLNEMLLVGLFTALMGQVHFYPFGTDFRITIGVVIFSFLILYFHSIPIIPTSIIAAAFVLFIRVGLDVWANMLVFDVALYKHLPAFIYYISFGLIIYYLNFRKYTEKPIYFILIVGSADFISNIIELFIRNQLTSKPLDAILSTIMLAAFLRSITVLAMFWIIKYYNLIITKEEHQIRYQELLMLTAKLKSEIFFLSKSMLDIENAMAKSYSIYNRLKEDSCNNRKEKDKLVTDSLNLSIDIHEIKKDYHRIVMSMEKLIPSKHVFKTMMLGDIFKTIKEMFGRYLEVINKDIQLTFEMDYDFKTDKYFMLISILNNLIQNSVEASSGSKPLIAVKSRLEDDHVVFSVQDNGKGISEKDRDLVFEPGYTTKFNPETGQVSTGLGLTHVKLLAGYLGGSVCLNNKVPGVTEFMLRFPMEAMLHKGDENG